MYLTEKNHEKKPDDWDEHVREYAIELSAEIKKSSIILFMSIFFHFETHFTGLENLRYKVTLAGSSYQFPV